MTSMWGAVAAAPMDPAERAGYLLSLVLFLVGGILLLVFGIRRLSRRSQLLREQQARAAQQHVWETQQQAWPGQPGPGGQPQPGNTGEQSPYAPPQPGGPGEHPAYPPSQPMAPQPPETAMDAFGTERRVDDPTRPPGRTGSVIMIVVGALLLLGVLSNLANAAAGTT